MANTFDITVEQVLSESIPMTRPAMPPINTYTTPVFLSGNVSRGKVNIPVVSSVSSTQIDPTTFEATNDSVANGQTTLVHYSEQFGVANPDANRGIELMMLLSSHCTNLEKSLQAAINAPITTANFSSAVVTVASGSWAVANAETLLASVPSRNVMALASAYFVKTKSTWMPSGEENKLAELSELTGIGANIVGFAARSEALAFVYGYPSVGPANEVKVSKIRLPIGIDIQFARWYSRGGRSWRGSLDICAAVEVGQAGAMRLLASS